MKQIFCRRFKKSVSAVLAAAMSISVFTSVPASAENSGVSAVGKTTYTYDDYYVEYYVTDAWEGSQNVELTVYNTGEESILNWALKYDAQGEISNLWNAGIYEQNDSEYVIRNVDWNFEIAPNQCIMYGYRLTGDDISLPEKFEICSKRVDVTENYDVTYKITNEWNTGVQGEIVITNYDDTPLEAWTLIFDSNFAVNNLWNGRVLENNGTSCTITAEVWTNPVQPDSSITIGFIGTKESGTAAILNNFRLTEVAIGEGNGTVTPVDPPAGDEEIEITANAAYDEENGNITVSWTSNNQDGTFDILMSADGENFTSVGTVSGVSEYVYTPESDFDTLYFKVVQTVGDKSAKSNIVPVKKQNTEEIDWSDTTDTDNDGLTDVYEKNYFETDPTNPDTDGDGLPDGYEVYFLGTDPKKADSDDNGINDGDEDFDNDGLSNSREYELGTDPNNADSDHDRLTDSEEVNTYNTNPLKYDTDEDGISDGDEIVLGLDPTNAATDGTPDAERTFMQHVGADSEIFSDINTPDNPFEVSIDITAAGVAANNLYSHKSGYSNAIKNDAILGVTPEFTYTDGLKVEDVILSFTIDNSAVMNYNNKYTGISDEFVGIKRLNVFKFFEDTNMLLPIETFHDVENNRVYTHTDELGTYCLMDMEMWLESLGISIEAAPVSQNSLQLSTMKAAPPASDEIDETPVDIVFYIQYGGGIYGSARTVFDTQKKMIDEISKRLFAVRDNVRIKIVKCMSINYQTVGKGWLTDYDDVKAALSSIKYEKSDYYCQIIYCAKSNYGYLGYRTNAAKFMFTFINESAFVYDTDANTLASMLSRAHVSYLEFVRGENGNANSYVKTTKVIVDATEGLEFKKTFTKYDENDEILEEAYDYIIKTIAPEQTAFKTIVPMNWKSITLDNILDPNNKADTDKDGLTDWKEADISHISWDKGGTPILPTVGECLSFAGKRYGENAFERFVSNQYALGGMPSSAADQYIDNILNNMRVLPIISDPTSVDGDKDGLPDGNDPLMLCYYNNSAVRENFSKDNLENVASYYWVNRMYDEFGNPNSEKTIEYYYNLYNVKQEQAKNTSADIVLLQKCLEFLGYLDLTNYEYNGFGQLVNVSKTPYGTYGGLTKAAVKLYQSNYRLDSEYIIENDIVDDTTFYSVVLAAMNYGYEFDDLGKKYCNQAETYFDNIYIPKSFPMNPIDNIPVVKRVSTLHDDIYLYDLTIPFNKILQHGAQEFHAVSYDCDLKSMPVYPYSVIKRYSDCGKTCEYKSMKLYWLYNNVKNKAKYDIKTKGSWEKLFQIVNYDFMFYGSQYPFIYNGNEINAEQFGNILFGFCCNAGAYSLELISSGGSVYSFLTTDQFDNAEDTEMVKKGYEMFNEYSENYDFLHGELK